MASLFFSYSHKDEALRDQLAVQLAGLSRLGLITSWHDRRILPGSVLDDEIDSHLAEADIVLLLISPDFIASDYCYNREMQVALQRAEEKKTGVLPIILRPCDWKELPIGRYLAAPTDGRPVTKWPNLDEAFLNVVEAIKVALTTFPRTNVQRKTIQDSKPTSQPSNSFLPRSSNLQVKKRFTDYDTDAFRNDAFDYLAKFFEGSLEELVKREPSLQQKFREIDAETFTAAVYLAGEKVCRCTIRIASGHGRSKGIEYSMRDDARDHSMNEAAYVECDDQKLYFRPLNMQSRVKDEANLSQEGLAEFFWEIFFSPISAKDRRL